MKILFRALAVTLVVGSASTASAAHVRSHGHVATHAYDALTPDARRPDPANKTLGIFQDDNRPSDAVTTGGPVGGLGS